MQTDRDRERNANKGFLKSSSYPLLQDEKTDRIQDA